MSDKGTVSPKEKEATEKRGRGRPRKQPQVKTSDVSSPILFFYLLEKVCCCIFYYYYCIPEITIRMYLILLKRWEQIFLKPFNSGLLQLMLR